MCHWQCSGRDNTGRSGRHGTQFDHRALSGVTCGLYREIREFGRTVDPFFKKNGKGTVLPIKITGNRKDPKFGLELFGKKK